MSDRRWWVGAIFLFVMGDAVAMQTRGALLPSFQSSFDVSEGLLGLVAPAGTVGFVGTVLAVGFVTGWIDLKRALLVGVVGTGLALVVMSVAPIYPIFLLFLLAQGAATGIVRGIDRPILSHVYPARRGRIFTLYSLAWAVGAVAGPLLVNAGLALADWRVTYALLGVAFLPIAAVLWRLDLPTDGTDERALSLSGLRALLRDPAILGVGVGMALVGGIEGIVFTWLPYYATDFVSREQSNLLLSTYLLAYVPGRALYSWLIGRVRYLDLAIAITAAALPVLYLVFTGIEGVALFALVFLAGFFVSGLFPALSSFGIDARPEYSGPVNAIATGSTYAGIALAPLAVGAIAERSGVATGMLLTVALTGCLLAVTIATRAASPAVGEA